MFGFQIHPTVQGADDSMIAAFRALPVANISDVMSRMTAGGAKLRPMHGGGQLSGRAVTVKTRPGDNLMIHHAIDVSGPGDVIVVDGGGDLTNSLIGEMMVTYAGVRGIAGFVIYGAVRDAAALRAGSMPVFAAGVTHRGPYKDGPGELNAPIAIDGMVIHPGDIIVGDDDGILCVPLSDAPGILKEASEKLAQEDVQRANFLKGVVNRDWVMAALKKGGCILPPQEGTA